MYDLARDGNAARPTACPECGQAVPESAQFCGACGAATSVLDAAPTSPIPFPRADAAPEAATPELETAERVPGRNPWVPILGTVLAVALVVAALLVWNDAQTHNHLTATSRRLVSTRSSLVGATADLSRTQSRLATTQTQLDSSDADLEQTKKSLATAKQQLSGVSNSLSDAKSRLNIESSQIETLKSCLNGVTTALSDVAYGDVTSAVSALDAVQVSCDAANRIIN
jgi:hypothetical protein